MIPNAITFLRILLIPPIVTLLLCQRPLWALALFLLTAATDAVDGFLARRMNQVSEVGKFLDPLADKLLVISVLVVLIELGKVSSVPVLLIIAREFWVSGIRIARKESLPSSRLAKVKTVLQILAAAMLIAGVPYGTEMLWLAVIVSIVSGIEYARERI